MNLKMVIQWAASIAHSLSVPSIVDLKGELGWQSL
jgi:hypothetical protein